jgi:hypothetical protein
MIGFILGISLLGSCGGYVLLDCGYSCCNGIERQKTPLDKLFNYLCLDRLYPEESVEDRRKKENSKSKLSRSRNILSTIPEEIEMKIE